MALMFHIAVKVVYLPKRLMTTSLESIKKGQRQDKYSNTWPAVMVMINFPACCGQKKGACYTCLWPVRWWVEVRVWSDFLDRSVLRLWNALPSETCLAILLNMLRLQLLFDPLFMTLLTDKRLHAIDAVWIVLWSVVTHLEHIFGWNMPGIHNFIKWTHHLYWRKNGTSLNEFSVSGQNNCSLSKLGKREWWIKKNIWNLYLLKKIDCKYHIFHMKSKDILTMNAYFWMYLWYVQHCIVSTVAILLQVSFTTGTLICLLTPPMTKMLPSKNKKK